MSPEDFSVFYSFDGDAGINCPVCEWVGPLMITLGDNLAVARQHIAEAHRGEPL